LSTLTTTTQPRKDLTTMTILRRAILFLVAFASASAAPFELPELPYKYDALQPIIGEKTLRTHHTKHHAK